MVPYLKGIHHTLESWRFGRDADGWKQGREDIIDWLNSEVDFEAEAFGGEVTKRNWKEALKSYRAEREGEAPTEVEPVRRLKKDLEALDLILCADKPISRLVRGTKMKKVRLMFGDASGSGFGATWETSNGLLRFRHGLWEDEFDESSSNLRELQNLVDSLETMAVEEDIEGLEIFVFTDNSTAERAFFKGTSKSESLHDLVLRLRLLETAAGCKIHMVHVAGTRMIAQGADGLSRGNLTEGVMGGWDMGDFVPLHLNAMERSASLESWIRSWFDAGRKTKSELLEPEGWFERGHDIIGGDKNVDDMWIPKYQNGCYIWSPPPAAAEVALEQLRQARHKRQSSCHVFVCPRLMTPYWAKHLNRSADLITVIPPGTDFWPSEMHEPLILACYLPFLKHRPWQLKGQEALLGLEKQLRKVWKENPGSGGSLLWKLWRKSREMDSMSEKLVCKMLHSRRGLFVSNCKTRKRRRSEVGKEGGS